MSFLVGEIKIMSNIDNLRTRLNYRGGANQQDRMKADKLYSLKKALLYSYQAETIRLDDGREFRCLLNPDKDKMDYDQKILSIPFEDICLNKEKFGKTTEGIEPIGLRGGDVFTWVDNDTKWLIYLEHLEETAYFRAEVRRCKEYVEINGNKYYVYIRGPVETTIKWLQKGGIEWNDLNYSLEMFITKNEETLDFFHRFQKIKVNGNTWQVKAVDEYHADGVLQILLGEYFNNTIKDEYYVEPTPTEPTDLESPHIKGDDVVKPFSIVEYSIVGLENGEWEVDNSKKAKIISIENDKLTLEIVASKHGNFNLSYKTDNELLTLPITIASL